MRREKEKISVYYKDDDGNNTNMLSFSYYKYVGTDIRTGQSAFYDYDSDKIQEIIYWHEGIMEGESLIYDIYGEK